MALAKLATTEPLPATFLRARFRNATPVENAGPGLSPRPAVEAIIEGDYGLAIEQLQTIILRRRDDPEIAAYLGIAFYLADQRLADAEDLLRIGSRHPDHNVSRTASWYLANTLLKTGRPEEARDILVTLAVVADFSGRRASQVLDDLRPALR